MTDINWGLACTIAPFVGFLGMYAGGFWGVGCAWLIVPSMLIFFDCTPMQAAGVGLLQMAPSIIGTVCKETPTIGWKRGSIGRELVVPLAVGGAITSFCGRPINVFFNDFCGKTALFIGFGVFMFFIGVQTLFGKARAYGDETPEVFTTRSRFFAFLGGLGAGVFSSVLGVGGAMVFRPVLANGFKVAEMETAKCTRFLLLTTTLIGGLNYLFNTPEGFDTKIFVLSAAIAVGGAIGFPLGARAHRIVVAAGYAHKARQCFAVICGIVCVNALLCSIGLEYYSRRLMPILAVALMLFLYVWKEKARKQLADENDKIKH